ncbi:MAG: polymerase, sigma-24 subunit, subfamily [Actinomycetia bacterium]|nr:polymerase, sigma-24 subunit, subfamily [Actinomycetes bacterium]
MTERFGESFDGVLAAAHAGEGWAFERLFAWLGRPVAAYFRGTGVEDPDGSANDVFLRAFTALGRFAGDEDRFRSWVFTIAHNLVVDERRRMARRPRRAPLDAAGPDPGPSSADAADEALASLGDERVARLLDGLAPDQRDVVLLRIVADLSIEDTAAALGKRPGAVKALQHRAMRSLRATLGEEGVTP